MSEVKTMNKFSVSLLMIGAAITLNAQDEDVIKSWYVKASLTNPFAETKVYLGDNSMGWSFELGYDWAMPDNFSFISPRISYARFLGDPRPDFDRYQPQGGTSPAFDLNIWQLGLNFKYQSPIKGLRPWLGISLNYNDGNQTTDGVNPVDPVTVAHFLGESQAKFGVALGVDYIFYKDFSVHFAYDFTYWRSYPVSNVNAQRIPAFNPIKPSWFTFSAGYRF
jgi:hypothetical protein